jgi:hypothetical protein
MAGEYTPAVLFWERGGKDPGAILPALRAEDNSLPKAVFDVINFVFPDWP